MANPRFAIQPSCWSWLLQLNYDFTQILQSYSSIHRLLTIRIPVTALGNGTAYYVYELKKLNKLLKVGNLLSTKFKNSFWQFKTNQTKDITFIHSFSHPVLIQ